MFRYRRESEELESEEEESEEEDSEDKLRLRGLDSPRSLLLFFLFGGLPLARGVGQGFVCFAGGFACFPQGSSWGMGVGGGLAGCAIGSPSRPACGEQTSGPLSRWQLISDSHIHLALQPLQGPVSHLLHQGHLPT